MSFNIAIDGPAGAGKSTIAKITAKSLGFIYVDTGAMYRAIALKMLRMQADILDTRSVKSILEHLHVAIRYEDNAQQVYLDGENVSDLIRQEAVGNMASKCAALPEVRKKLLNLQRDLAASDNVIMDGRDIGTCVLPDADLKVYLTADAGVRAKRRCLELAEKGQPADEEQIRKDIETRDYQDMHREIAPLAKAQDAVVIDSSYMTIEEVANKIMSLYEERNS